MDTLTSIAASTVEHAAAPATDVARGLLGDCDLRWLFTITGLCFVALWLVAVR